MKTETNGAAAVLAAARQQYVGVLGEEAPDGVDGERCVCCGEIVPEGRMVCPVCESGRWPGKG